MSEYLFITILKCIVLAVNESLARIYRKGLIDGISQSIRGCQPMANS